ncbi:choline ABC transporter permease subunit [Kiloniella laminariae]|uniref:Choline ABC transporter permease subunit n=1 Tax=Kiloniella laminariae TaxID=454162 RepID=A0ABT4LNV3_9PROT|nr:choline ABC transporter permease subunit [Kiloniella laminariae]MCZ4282818.1 choline ABC transporter permease subunit [Kiloniella laminariae]
MSSIEEWLIENKVPVGKWGESFFDFLIDNFSGFFDLFSDVMSFLIKGSVDILLYLPPIVLVALIAALAHFLQRSWKLSLFVFLSLLFIINQGYWQEAIQSLVLVIYSTMVCMVVGVPLGIAAAHRPWLFSILRPILDLMQTIPTFVYLIPAMILLGLGMVPGMIATVIFAVAAPIRLTHLGVSSVPTPLIEAAESFGATKSQLLWKVEIPFALPTIIAGVTQCIMLSLSMVVIAAMVGAPGLGVPVLRALSQVKPDMGIEAGLAIVIIAILLDRLCKQRNAPVDGA